MKPTLCLSVLGGLVLFIGAGAARCGESDAQRLVREIAPFQKLLSGGQRDFSLTADLEVPIDDRVQPISVRLARFGEQSFDLEIKHAEYWIQLNRRDDMTAFVLPRHNVAFVGRGPAEQEDHLSPAGIFQRLIGPGSLAADYVSLAQGDAATMSLLLTGAFKVKFDSTASRWSVGSDVWFQFGEEPTSLTLVAGAAKIRLTLADAAAPPAGDLETGIRKVDIARGELERQLARGVRRALEIVAPSRLLTSPNQEGRKAEHGELRWVGGQRVALLEGTPEEVGKAHGELLREEALRCVDSVLYAFGTVETVRTGRWFRHDLEAAYERLQSHIPERHKREMQSLAAALDLDPRLVTTVNVFPELFHCSGFAVFGTATQGGKLYHGRVLDYMTAIGLQDAATTFVVKVDGRIPFANVGYAGFIGSVSGMNAQAISLGEMGGRGEGRWDGTPMATLMRRGLEECSTLDEVMELWKSSPRTCEYFYVFADGKTNRAVGVAAVPESVEFVWPGQSHSRLGEGIADTVVMSAGSRLEKLRERVQERHGKIDAEAGQWLMSRPVAMESNLHNVLFVPEDRVLYVANADHKRPAAECPYVRLDLNALLGTAEPATAVTALESPAK